jgi:hypothetical protein
MKSIKEKSDFFSLPSGPDTPLLIIVACDNGAQCPLAGHYCVRNRIAISNRWFSLKCRQSFGFLPSACRLRNDHDRMDNHDRGLFSHFDSCTHPSDFIVFIKLSVKASSRLFPSVTYFS